LRVTFTSYRDFRTVAGPEDGAYYDGSGGGDGGGGSGSRLVVGKDVRVSGTATTINGDPSSPHKRDEEVIWMDSRAEIKLRGTSFASDNNSNNVNNNNYYDDYKRHDGSVRLPSIKKWCAL